MEKDKVLELVKCFWKSIYKLPKHLQNDKDIVLEVVKLLNDKDMQWQQ